MAWMEKLTADIDENGPYTPTLYCDNQGGLDWMKDSKFYNKSKHIGIRYMFVQTDMVEQGRLTLDRPIGDLLPEIAAPQVLEGFDAGGAPRLRPAKRPITLRHLLTHTAGFVYDIWNAEMGRYMEQAGVPGIITCQNAALALPLVFEPGEKWDYGINIDWVGKAVERASGQKLGDHFAEHLFAPIGMWTPGSS